VAFDLFNTPGSPHWWLLRLNALLDERNLKTQLYEDYYEGDHRLAFAMAKYRQAFGDLFDAFASNWCKLVPDVTVERLRIDGFRFGGDRQGDRDAWRIWQANGLDADSVLAHTEAVKCGEAALLVQPGGGNVPSITVEHPSQVIVANAPGSRRLRAAALKRWIDDDGTTYGTVYLPNGIYKFERMRKVESPLILPGDISDGGWRERARVPFEEANPLGVVPVVPLRNDPHLLKGGRSDLDDVIPLQDAINKTITDMLVDSEYHGFPQRWATGLEIPDDPVTGKPRTDLFLASSGSVWTSADPQVKFGQFELGDLGQYEKAANLLVRHLSAQTRTPPHYLVGEIVNASGDALKAAETGLTFKVARKQLMFGEAWEEAVRLAFAVAGDSAKAQAVGAETIWGEAESRSWGELVDAAVKLRSINVPYEAIWEFLGFSQEQIEQFRATMNLPTPPAPSSSSAPEPDPAAAAA
jgi:hypothetical protein